VIALDISELSEGFPNFAVALLAASGLSIEPDRAPALDAVIETVEAEAAAALAATPSGRLPEIGDWRAAYRAFGVKKTSYRCSVERLLRGIERNGRLPRVNNLVDCYNAASLRHRMPVGADDLDRLSGNLSFRYARPGDSFIALGDGSATNDPPKAGEVVYADQEKLLCRRWNWYQDARSAISPATRRAVLTVQTLGPRERLAQAAEELAAWCRGHLSAGVE
jgi:DNA/RNA-binding domain of Phe-tRNA-synthetase-like protein